MITVLPGNRSISGHERPGVFPETNLISEMVYLMVRATPVWMSMEMTPPRIPGSKPVHLPDLW
jgi:hypothetical protein